MEYVFGTVRKGGVNREFVRTKGKERTELRGRVSVERRYADRFVTDTFDVVEKYNTAPDEDGNHYNWYFIANHSRDTDMFTPQKEALQAQIDYIAMMADVDLSEGDEKEMTGEGD